MKATNNIRNSIIDKLVSDDIIQLSQVQIKILDMSDDDIKNNRTKSQEDVDKEDLEWLRGL